MNTDVYLQACPYVDWHHDSVLAQAALLSQGKHDIFSVTKSCFEFVRDEIKHSWDYRTNRVTVTASEALEQGSGFCYSKSHLLAALLRANAIPTAIVYQRMQLDQRSSYCLHALNAVCLPEYGWYRLDARGNTADIDAQFTPPVEKLAIELFGLGEFFLEGLFASPLPCVTHLLESCESVDEVVQRITETDAWDRDRHE